MKIVFTSDWHIICMPHEGSERFRSFLYQVSEEKPDYIVLGGDDCERWEYIEEFCSFYRKEVPDTKTLMLLGNHDLWAYRKDATREEIYDMTKAACKKYDITFLEEDPIVDDRTLLCGSVSWYDYSAKVDDLTAEYLETNKGRYNNDGNYLISSKSDKEFAVECQERLLKNIKKHQNKVDQIFVFSHMALLKEMLASPVASYRQREWDVSNCYFYNFTIGKELLKNKKVKLIVCGHIHRYMSGTLPNGIVYATCGSDYGNPEYVLIDINGDDIFIQRKS